MRRNRASWPRQRGNPACSPSVSVSPCLRVISDLFPLCVLATSCFRVPFATRPSAVFACLALIPIIASLSGCHARHPFAPSPSPSVPLFRDVAAAEGIRFRQGHGGKSPLNIQETLGTGCAFLDADGDGWLDLFFVGEGGCALYRNRGAGAVPAFEEVTAGSGVPGPGKWTGCAVGDIDGDGRPDLVVTGYNCLRLLHNEGGMKFRDITAGSGLDAAGWSTSAGFADFDGDGRLDLFVARYLSFGPSDPQLCQIGTEPGTGKTVMGACGPELYDPQFGSLYRNRGGGRFEDVTWAAGLRDAHGRGLGVAWRDIDGDGRPDLYVANDRMPADLFRNEGEGRFRNIGVASGTAYSTEGLVQGGMGVDFADIDGDGRPDLFVTTFTHEPKSLYRNDGGGRFTEVSALWGIGPKALPYVSFGTKFADFNNDGYLDLIMVNGHVVDTAGRVYADAPYAEPSLFYLGGPHSFTEATAQGGPDLLRPIVGRGLAVGDYDNDGRVDVLVANLEGAPLLLHNEAPAGGHSLRVRLEPRSGRTAEGAEVIVTAAGRRWYRWATTGGSFLSASDPRLHVGLGPTGAVDRLEVRWPDGARQVVTHPPVDRELRLSEAAR